MNKAMTGQKTFFSIAAWCATVFFSSACLMVLEIAAGRLAAEELGSSLYTWTAVIGVVLAGMTFGTYAGGRIADRADGKRAIATLLAIASITCVGTIVLSNRIGGWSLLWRLSWPAYVLTYVSALFLLPSVLLGAVIPVAAKAALSRRLGTGRTIGSIYAFGAAGSIAGTFLAGFWLIGAIGTIGVIWATAAALLVVGLICSPRHRPLHLWAAILVLLVFLGTSRGRWAEQTGALLTLRSEPDPNVIYEDETQYCHIRVRRESDRPDRRTFYQDKLKHSEVIMGDITDLQYPYVRIYATVTEQTSQGINDPAFLSIGGGGFVLPRYLKRRWPASRVDVAEIDPGVAKAAIAAFGLPKHHNINIFAMDGRNFVDGLIARKRAGYDVGRYDFIYGDACDNYSVPYQLVTREFNEKVSQLLNKGGFYMLNLIDFYKSGLVVGSVLNTLQQTFRNVCVLSPKFDYYNRATFVLIASNRTFDVNSIVTELGRYFSDIWCLSAAETEKLKDKCGRIVLTDDYAPVDNLAAPIAIQSGSASTARVYIAEAQQLSKSGGWGKPVELYMKAISAYPPLTVKSYYDISEDLLAHREYQEALFACRKALQYYDRPQIRNDISSIHFNTGIAMKALGQIEDARKHINQAIEGYKSHLQKDPNAADVLSNLGMAIAENGGFAEAAGYFRRAIKIDPSNLQYRFMLAEALIAQRDYAGAQVAVTEAIDYMKQAGNREAVFALQRLLGRVTYEGSQPSR